MASIFFSGIIPINAYVTPVKNVQFSPFIQIKFQNFLNQKSKPIVAICENLLVWSQRNCMFSFDLTVLEFIYQRLFWVVNKSLNSFISKLNSNYLINAPVWK